MCCDQRSVRSAPAERLSRQQNTAALLGEPVLLVPGPQQHSPVRGSGGIAQHRPVLVAYRRSPRGHDGSAIRADLGIPLKERSKPMKQFCWGMLAMASLIAGLI